MEETLFPPSPSWFLPNIIAARKDGTVSYGSKNNIVILKSVPDKKPEMLIIRGAHAHRITAVAFSPPNCSQSIQNTIVSCSEDGFVKLWKIDTLTATIGHKCHWEQKEENEKVISLSWSVANPHSIVSAAENNTLVLWDVLSNNTKKFSFLNLRATIVSCCPYNEKIVAVGGKTGQIYIISLTGNGHVLYRLRGHDNKINSLSWCPIPYNVFQINDIQEEFLLASACQNKEVSIWRTGTDGKCESKFQIPTSALCKRDGLQHGKVGNSFSYVALSWLEPYKIYSSSNFGELIYFDIKIFLSNKVTNGASVTQKSNKQSLNFIKLGHCFHTKGLFAIAGTPMKCEIEIYKSTNIKSDLKVSMESNDTEVIKKNNEYNGEATWDVIIPDTTSLLWTACQDRKLVACQLKSSKMEIVHNYNTVNGIVYCAVVSPHDPNKLAIGAGDGMIRLWNLTEPCGDIQVYWQKIKDRVMSLAWHPTKDGLLAYGTSEGRVGLIDTKSNKLPNVFKPSHPQPIYNLSWGPQFPSDNKDTTSNVEFDLYSVGNNTLLLYNTTKLNSDPLNLSKIISFSCTKQTDICWKPDYSLMAVGNEDGSICLVEPSQFKIVYTILAYKKMIHSLAWHPSSTSTDAGLSSYHGYLTSASTDNNHEIRVFNCRKEEDGLKVEQVAILNGHHGQIQSVSWCPHISCRLVSGSADGSVQIWDVVSQTPLVNFSPSGVPIFSMWSPIDPDYMLTGCKNDALYVWRISTQTKVSPAKITKTKKSKSGKSNMQLSISKEKKTEESEPAANVAKWTEDGCISVAEIKATVKNSNESKMFSGVWKGNENDELKNCYHLLKTEENVDKERKYSLPFFRGEEDFKESIKAEEESCKKANKCTEMCEIALWNGNIKGMLQEKIASGQLNDFLVSLAPIISPKVWQEACLSYSKTLAEKKLYRKAASYLIVCHKIYEAINLLMDANLYLEAIFIARSRLPKIDPMLEKIVRRYAQKLFKNGSLLKACECYVYLGDYLEVAKICGKSKHPEYLNLAALAAKKCGSLDLQTLEATNTLFKCFETNNLKLAQQVCDDNNNVKHLGLILFVYNTLQQLERGDLELKVDILSHVRETFETENIVFPSFLPKLFHKYNSYKNKGQVHTVVAQELSFAACVENTEEILTHLIRALSTCYRYDQSSGKFHPLYELCHWLSPQGFLSQNSIFKLQDSQLSSKIKSLRSYLAASIVMHLHNNEETIDVIKYFDVLRELKDDLLDADSYKYFKNLLTLNVCEKEFLESHGRLSRRIIENEKHFAGDSESNTTEEQQNLNGENDTHETVDKISFESETDVETRGESEKIINGSDKNQTNIRDSGNVGNPRTDVGSDAEDEDESDSGDALKKKLGELNRVKIEIENFEKQRISCPHPFPVCAWLKKLCEKFPQNESANLLLQDLEEKWFQMN